MCVCVYKRAVFVENVFWKTAFLVVGRQNNRCDPKFDTIDYQKKAFGDIRMYISNLWLTRLYPANAKKYSIIATAMIYLIKITHQVMRGVTNLLTIII